MPGQKDNSGRATLTVEEAAKLLGIGRSQGYEAAARGELPIIRIGKRMLVPKAALERMLDQPAPKVAA
jgi:excisionase family DNA binding protein